MKRNLVKTLVILVFILSVLNFSCSKLGEVSCGIGIDLPWCNKSLKNGDKEYTAGNWEQALNLYQQYLAEKPNAKNATEVQAKISNCYFNLGEKAFKEKKFEEAIQYYSKSQNPEAKTRIDESNLALGDSALEQGDYEKALSYYRKVQSPEADAKISEVNYGLAEIAFQNSNWQKAIELYSQSQNPDASAKISKCYFNLGEEAFAQNDFQTALDYYSKSQEPGVEDKIKACEKALNKQPATAEGPQKPTESWAILVRSFANKADAQDQVAKLKNLGFSAFISGDEFKGYKVYAGNYPSKAQAEKALNKLIATDKKYRGGIVVKLK